MITDRLLYIHLDRTGGHLFRAVLESIDGLDIIDDWWHLSLAEMRGRCEQRGMAIPPAVVFIRNPWSWYVSMWGWCRAARASGFNGSFADYMNIQATKTIDSPNFQSLSSHWNYYGASGATYIARFEQLHDEVVAIFDKFMPDLIDVDSSRRLVESMPVIGASIASVGDWRQYYDAQLKGWVANEDGTLIERFGYEFT